MFEQPKVEPFSSPEEIINTALRIQQSVMMADRYMEPGLWEKYNITGWDDATDRYETQHRLAGAALDKAITRVKSSGDSRSNRALLQLYEAYYEVNRVGIPTEVLEGDDPQGLADAKLAMKMQFAQEAGVGYDYLWAEEPEQS